MYFYKYSGVVQMMWTDIVVRRHVQEVYAVLIVHLSDASELACGCKVIHCESPSITRRSLVRTLE